MAKSATQKWNCKKNYSFLIKKSKSFVISISWSLYLAVHLDDIKKEPLSLFKGCPPFRSLQISKIPLRPFVSQIGTRGGAFLTVGHRSRPNCALQHSALLFTQHFKCHQWGNSWAPLSISSTFYKISTSKLSQAAALDGVIIQAESLI